MRLPFVTAAVTCALSINGCSGEQGQRAIADSSSPADPEAVTDVVPDLVRGTSMPVVVDQFGYRPDERKIAVLRDPRTGADSGSPLLQPDDNYFLVETGSAERRLTMQPLAWRSGSVDESSGDRVWWLDFTSVRAPGEYRIENEAGELLAGPFAIDDTVYDALLVQALRTFYYQRAGQAKALPWADTRWADAASHVGPGQDSQARRYDTPSDASSERDLSGGWYDAGDYNRYTHWTAGYILEMLHAWDENPDVWGDDFGLPDSGNGIPDLLDEVQWGLDWLARMQEADGSLLSVLDADEASPPSSALGPSRYGPASTAATLGGAAAFAFAASRFANSGIDALLERADGLLDRAERAWDWAEANPSVTFRNNDASVGTQGVGAGQQEPDERGLARLQLSAAIYLAQASGEERYRRQASAALPDTLLIGSRYVSPFESAVQRDALFFADTVVGDLSGGEDIRDAYLQAVSDERFFSAGGGPDDAYLAYLDEYVWGSNGFRAKKGLMYLELLRYGLGERNPATVRQAALDHLHYLHGLNPLGLVYLSNTGEYGAERSVGTVYHLWFTDDSPLWDSVERSEHGPLPGLLVGGPNPTYRPADCCPASCGLPEENERCALADMPPLTGQPVQKSFAEWNEGFPLNSWQMTENSNEYQTSYLRLLGWFASAATR